MKLSNKLKKNTSEDGNYLVIMEQNKNKLGVKPENLPNFGYPKKLYIRNQNPVS